MIRNGSAEQVATIIVSLRAIKNDSTGCLEFAGYVNAKGYGTIKMSRRQSLAHRVVWEAKHGPIPVGMMICHRCDNPRCVSIDHLFIGTHSDNQADMYAKGRGRKACGESNGRAKLTVEDVVVIRRMRESGVRQSVLAKTYGMSESAISSVVRGEHWTSETIERSRRLRGPYVRRMSGQEKSD